MVEFGGFDGFGQEQLRFRSWHDAKSVLTYNESKKKKKSRIIANQHARVYIFNNIFHNPLKILFTSLINRKPVTCITCAINNHNLVKSIIIKSNQMKSMVWKHEPLMNGKCDTHQVNLDRTSESLWYITKCN